MDNVKSANYHLRYGDAFQPLPKLVILLPDTESMKKDSGRKLLILCTANPFATIPCFLFAVPIFSI